jgi:hypothetical protein
MAIYLSMFTSFRRPDSSLRSATSSLFWGPEAIEAEMTLIPNGPSISQTRFGWKIYHQLFQEQVKYSQIYIRTLWIFLQSGIRSHLAKRHSTRFLVFFKKGFPECATQAMLETKDEKMNTYSAFHPPGSKNIALGTMTVLSATRRPV